MSKTFYVYIMASRSKVLYTGITNNLERRVWEHKNKMTGGFTKKFNVSRLVYYEETDDVGAAIGYEKKIKGWLRNKKIKLIESQNPEWKDIAKDWFDN